MGFFADAKARRWTVTLTIGDVARVKSESGGKFDLLSPDSKLGEGDAAKELRMVLDDDPLEFYELLAYLIDPQLRAAEVTHEEFGSSLEAEHILSAQEAFFREWIDFFRKLQRMERAMPLEKIRKYRQMAIAKVQRTLDKLDLAKMDARVEQEMDRVLMRSSGKLLDDLDSILGRSPGASYT